MDYVLPFDPPLLPNFVDYVAFEGVILPHEVDRIREMRLREAAEKATVSADDPYDDKLRKSSVLFLDPGESTRWIYERITMFAVQCNMQHFGFDLRGYLQSLQLARYDTGDFFDWHMDFHSGEISHRKLSVTVQLSDPEDYEGGDLQFMINNRIESAPRKKGTIVVFPSFMVHRVTPIESGTRYSIVGWLSGPPYR